MLSEMSLAGYLIVSGRTLHPNFYATDNLFVHLIFFHLSLLSISIFFCYSEMPIKLLASQKTHSEMSSEVSEVYKQLTTDLSKAHRDYKNKEKRNEKDKLLHGSITDNKQAELDGAKRLFEKLFAAVSGLSEATGGEMPALEVIYCYL